eukprot:scaffold23615_cov66-Phaeocystis_antarctica.AAC.5
MRWSLRTSRRVAAAVWPLRCRDAGVQRSARLTKKLRNATVQAQRDPGSRASSLCVRGPYYECNVRGYAVLPVVDIRSLGLLCHAVSHQYRNKAKFTKQS